MSGEFDSGGDPPEANEAVMQDNVFAAGDLTDFEKVRLVDRWVLEQVSRSQEVLAELDRRKRAAETAQ